MIRKLSIRELKTAGFSDISICSIILNSNPEQLIRLLGLSQKDNLKAVRFAEKNMRFVPSLMIPNNYQALKKSMGMPIGSQ